MNKLENRHSQMSLAFAQQLQMCSGSHHPGFVLLSRATGASFVCVSEEMEVPENSCASGNSP